MTNLRWPWRPSASGGIHHRGTLASFLPASSRIQEAVSPGPRQPLVSKVRDCHRTTQSHGDQMSIRPTKTDFRWKTAKSKIRTNFSNEKVQRVTLEWGGVTKIPERWAESRVKGERIKLKAVRAVPTQNRSMVQSHHFYLFQWNFF